MIQTRFGERIVTTAEADLQPWLTDWRGKFHGRSPAILSPAETDEVAAIVALAAELGVPLVPQGGNTSMVGGATPPPDGSAVLLSLRGMNRLRSIDPGRNIAIAEAGMILANLHDAAAEVSRRFPLTLGARGSCTVGGLVATNAGGTQVLKFGTMRSLVAGVEAVLPDGSVYDGLKVLKKDNRGYSIDQLLVGSEGTLGIVTAAALRLVPAIALRAVAWVGIATSDAALEMLHRLQEAGEGVEGFELIPGDALQLVLEHVPGTRPPLAQDHAWHALIEATSCTHSEDPGEFLGRVIAAALQDGTVEDAVIASSEVQANDFWRVRDSISEAERAEGPTLAHDISVPVDDMPSFIGCAVQEAERAFPGVSASAFGHLGDGNVHFHVRASTLSARDFAAAAPAITRLVHDLVTNAGGSISAEHGIGQMKLDEFERLAPPGRLAALRAIKHALDPQGIMNPGKLIRV